MKTMKKLTTLLALLLLSSAIAGAQDLITRKNGEEIVAKVLEVGPSDVKYILFDERESGPVYVIPRSDVLVIRYESGRSEVFNAQYSSAPAATVVPGMTYQQLKNIYNYREYVPGIMDRYNIGGLGVASFFITGLGECITGEWGRGLMKSGINFVLICSAAAFFSNATVYNRYGERLDNNSTMTLFGSLCMAGVLAVDIWSIIDASRIAIVKNMYYRDLQGFPLDLRMYPSISYAPGANAFQAAPGLTFSVRF